MINFNKSTPVYPAPAPFQPETNRLQRTGIALFDTIGWFFKNRRQHQSRPANIFCDVKLSTEAYSNERERIKVACKFMRPNKGLEASEFQIQAGDPKRRKFRVIVNRVLNFLGIKLTADQAVQREMEKEAEGGQCYGSSLSIAGQLLKSDVTDCRQLRRDFNKVEAAHIQVIKGLMLELKDRVENYEIVQSRTDWSEATLKDGGCPKAIIQQWKDGEIATKLEKAQNHLEELEGLLEELTGLSISQSGFHKAKDDENRTYNEFVETIGEQTGPCLLNCFAPKHVSSPPGHTMMLDLSKNLFYDSNFGFYRYESQEACLAALFEHIETTYAWTLRGNFEVQSVQLPA